MGTVPRVCWFGRRKDALDAYDSRNHGCQRRLVRCIVLIGKDNAMYPPSTDNGSGHHVICLRMCM
jgi:hypothetical protein